MWYVAVGIILLALLFHIAFQGFILYNMYNCYKEKLYFFM